MRKDDFGSTDRDEGQFVYFTFDDEVQRAPELFTSLKAEVDGSAGTRPVHPLAQAKLAGEDSSFLPKLFKASFRAEPSGQRMGMLLADRVVAGVSVRTGACHTTTADGMVSGLRRHLDPSGYPSPGAYQRFGGLAASVGSGRRADGVSGEYIRTRRPFQLTHPTIGEYVTLLSRIFLLEELPPGMAIG
jgi:uncharacterized protein